MYRSLLMLIGISIILSSCKKYLDAKSDKTLVIPSTLEDAQALLDAFGTLNAGYYPLGLQSDDNYFLLDNYYNTLSTNNQYIYTWNKEALPNAGHYRFGYQMVLAANVALETVDKVAQTTANISEWRRIRASALFYRANAFYFLAQYFAQPYNKNTATSQLGIPLRLNSDASVVSVRSSLEQTWQQIAHDFKESASLFAPGPASITSRPCKAAAYAALARTCLTMQQFDLARQYSDSSLKDNSTLLDYKNIIVSNPLAPFPGFNANPEILFHSYSGGAAYVNFTNVKIDTLLFRSYAPNDCRSSLFFYPNGTGTVGFRGDYNDGGTGSSSFNGLAVDEVFLIRAECSARAGDKDSAMADLKRLMDKRWKANTYMLPAVSSAEQALDTILFERRKELLGRGMRWFDLRRLNQEPRFAITLKRLIAGQQYTLPPNDPRYTFYFPDDVIALTGMQQNVR